LRRVAIAPRHHWDKKVEALGLIFHTPNGKPYWRESEYYSFTLAEIEVLEKATAELQRLYLEAAQHVIDKDRFAELGLSAVCAEAIRESWEKEPPALYGRFDLAYSGLKGGAPKLLEYNADTPTSLLEAAVIQWAWLAEVRPGTDQWNSIHDRLIAKWTDLRSHLPGMLKLRSC
jgi:glutathionylspermidine synthase